MDNPWQDFDKKVFEDKVTKPSYPDVQKTSLIRETISNDDIVNVKKEEDEEFGDFVGNELEAINIPTITPLSPKPIIRPSN